MRILKVAKDVNPKIFTSKFLSRRLPQKNHPNISHFCLLSFPLISQLGSTNQIEPLELLLLVRPAIV